MAFEYIGLTAAVAAGTVSFLSPCVLPLVPGYLAFIAGNSAMAASDRFRTLILSVCFVAGFSAVFVSLGASTTLLSSLLMQFRTESAIVGGLLIIVFGLFTAGLFQLPFLQQDVRFHNLGAGGHHGGSFLLGIAFGFGWTPCIGPVLGAILTLSSVTDTAGSGFGLLLAYSLGLGIPFVVSAWFAEGIGQRLHRFRRIGRIMKVATGGVMVLMGVAMITGQLQRFSYWLLEAFPLLQQIG